MNIFNEFKNKIDYIGFRYLGFYSSLIPSRDKLLAPLLPHLDRGDVLVTGTCNNDGSPEPYYIEIEKEIGDIQTSRLLVLSSISTSIITEVQPSISLYSYNYSNIMGRLVNLHLEEDSRYLFPLYPTICYISETNKGFPNSQFFMIIRL